MRKLQNYQSFNENRKNDLLLEELMSTDSGAKPKFDSKSFRNFLTEKVNESASYIPEERINEMHALYELSVLANSRPNWNTDEEMMILESGEHVILFKNSELFIIESKTFDLINNINESSEEGGEKKPWYVKALNFIDTIGETAADVAPKIWTAMSNGAKKAWKFFKKCISLKDSHGKWDWGKICGFLAAIVGMFGAIPGWIAFTGPIAGGLLITGGVIHIKHGFHHMGEASEKLKGVGIRPLQALIASLGENIGAILSGIVGIVVGTFDIFHGATTALVNPAHGSIQAVIKEKAKSATETGVMGFIHHIHTWFEGIGEQLFHHIEPIAKGFASGAMTIATVICQLLIETILPWLWKKFLEVGTKFSEFLAKITNSANDMVEGLSKIVDLLSSEKNILIPGIGPVAFILGRGLKLLLPKLKEWIPKFCDSLKPVTERFQSFMKSNLEASKVLEKIREEEKKKGVHASKGAKAVAEPSDEELQGPVVAASKKVRIEEGDTSKEDKELLKQAMDQQQEGGEGEGGELNFKDSSKKLLGAMMGPGTREETIYDVFKKIKSDEQLKELISKYTEFAKSDDAREISKKSGNDKNSNLAVKLDSELDEYEVQDLNKIMKANGLKYRLSKDKKEFIIPEEK